MPDPGFREELQLLISAINKHLSRPDHTVIDDDLFDAVERADIVLWFAEIDDFRARCKPTTDDELNELWNMCGTTDEYGQHEGNIFQYAHAVLARWGQGNG
jgi:hypothetical protein